MLEIDSGRYSFIRGFIIRWLLAYIFRAGWPQVPPHQASISSRTVGTRSERLRLLLALLLLPLPPLPLPPLPLLLEPLVARSAARMSASITSSTPSRLPCMLRRAAYVLAASSKRPCSRDGSKQGSHTRSCQAPLGWQCIRRVAAPPSNSHVSTGVCSANWAPPARGSPPCR